MQLKCCEADIVQNLKDAGCSDEAIARLLECKDNGNTKELLCLLSKHRAALLDDVHRCQKRIDCLDYLVYQLKKKQENQ